MCHGTTIERMKRTVALLFSAVSLMASMTFAQVAEGDQLWAARAEGHQGGRANGATIDRAIAAYERAIAANPNDVEARWKLLRAIRFKGAYVAANNDQKKQVYNVGRKAGDAAIALVDKQLAAKGAKPKGSEKDVATAARSIAGAGEVYFWDAVNWGEWALAYGKMAAVKEGAADRIRREATIAMLVDPRMEGGGGARVLGRLHDQTPRVPFITGWASSKEAVRFLSESNRADPTNKITRVFLAEALVSNDSDNKPRAVQMLKDVVSSPNDPNFAVEDEAAQDDARALLAKWK